jgi:hypothetical protein
MLQTVGMAMTTVNRRWTVVTWMLARAEWATDSVTAALAATGPDAVALQSVGEEQIAEIAAALGMQHAWARSHHPRSRLIPGSAVGLAVLSPHRISNPRDHVIGEMRSLWSSKRRIAQTAVIERADHSAYTIAHAAERLDDAAVPTGAAPIIRIRPPQVGVDHHRGLEVPVGATTLVVSTTTPIDGLAAMQMVRFEMPWVEGDVAAG